MNLKEKIRSIIEDLYDADTDANNDDEAHGAITEARIALESYIED